MVYIEHMSWFPGQKDLDEINALNQEAFGVRGMSQSECIPFLKQHAVCVLARDDKTGTIIGKATIYILRLDDGTVKGWVENVVLRKDYQGSGVASLIDEEMRTIARERDATIIDLTSNPDKQRANCFYQKRGYKIRKTSNYRLTL